MKLNTAKIALGKMKSLPPLPAAVEQLSRICEDPDTSVQQIAQVISLDPVLTAKILQISNSAFFGFSKTIATVSQAVVILGINSTKNLALGLGIIRVVGNSSDRCLLNLEQFWRHSLAVAVVSRMLALRLCSIDPGVAFVSGLLHDIGKVVFIKLYAEEYADVLNMAAVEQKRLLQLEKEAFGMNHAEVGSMLCDYWKMSPHLSYVASRHHDWDAKSEFLDSNDPLLQIIGAGNNLAKIERLGISGNPYSDSQFPKFLSHNPEFHRHLTDVSPLLLKEILETEALFGLKKKSEGANSSQPQVSSAVAVCIDDPGLREFVAMNLTAQGYTLVPVSEAANDAAELTGIVKNNELPDDLAQTCSRRNIPVLEFSKLGSRIKDGEDSVFHIEHLQEWLREGLK